MIVEALLNGLWRTASGTDEKCKTNGPSLRRMIDFFPLAVLHNLFRLSRGHPGDDDFCLHFSDKSTVQNNEKAEKANNISIGVASAFQQLVTVRVVVSYRTNSYNLKEALDISSTCITFEL